MDSEDEPSAEHVEVVRDEAVVELRIDSREDLAMPFQPEHAVRLALQLQRAAADAKRYRKESEGRK